MKNMFEQSLSNISVCRSIAILLLMPAISQAAIVYQDDDRRIEKINYSLDYDTEEWYSSTSVLASDGTFSTSPLPSQSHFFNENSFGGTQTANQSRSNSSGFEEVSIFDITFELTQNSVLSYNSYIDTFSSEYGSVYSVAIYSGSDIDATNPLYSFVERYSEWYDSPYHAFEETLYAGVYRMVVSNASDANIRGQMVGATSTLEFTADFSPVPLPASIWLFTSALLFPAVRRLNKLIRLNS